MLRTSRTGWESIPLRRAARLTRVVEVPVSIPLQPKAVSNEPLN